MVFDCERGATLLFGGGNRSTHLADLWEWDGSDWIPLSPSNGPAARWGHAMVYDSHRRVVVCTAAWW